jgi:electron-transferring-flavoprotein dehydrogenase
MTDGGIQAMSSSLAFAGGAFSGESAGLMTVARLKGVHTAMKSGMLAAETASDVLGASKE